MAYTHTHLDALQEALASGTLTVTFEGRSMTYGSFQELQRAISVVQNSLNRPCATAPTVWHQHEPDRGGV